MNASMNARTRAGFALPMVLLVMVVLTAGIAAGFAATSSEIITNAAHRGDTLARDRRRDGSSARLGGTQIEFSVRASPSAW